jgi:hypothetical protein
MAKAPLARPALVRARHLRALVRGKGAASGRAARHQQPRRHIDARIRRSNARAGGRAGEAWIGSVFMSGHSFIRSTTGIVAL